MSCAYFAVVADQSTPPEPSPVLGWVSVPLELPVQESLSSEGGASAERASEEGIAAPAVLSDAAAQEQADQRTAAGRRAVRLAVTAEQWEARPLCGAVLENGVFHQGERTATVPLPPAD